GIESEANLILPDHSLAQLSKCRSLPLAVLRAAGDTAAVAGRNSCRQLLIDSIAVFLAQAGAQEEHQLDALALVEPVLERRCQLAVGGRGDGERAGSAELLCRQCAVAAQRPVPGDAAQLEILGKEQDHRDAVAAVEAQLPAQVAMLVAVEQAQVDALAVGLGTALQQWTLLNAVAAPDAADNQHLHVAAEARQQPALLGGQLGRVVDLSPAPLLVLRAGVDVGLIRKCGSKLLRPKRCVHGGDGA